MELEGKELGCWCKPSPCHGDILIKLFKERQGTNLYPPRSDYQEGVLVSIECGRNEENGDNVVKDECKSNVGNGLSVNSQSVFAPLRLRGGDTSPSLSNRNSQCGLNDVPLSFVNNSVSEQDTRELFWDSSDGSMISEPNAPDGDLNRKELPNFMNQDISMAEEGIRDILFDAGYSTQEHGLL